jgi:hypothetical protein
VEEDSKDRIHPLSGTGVPSVDEMDARMKAHGIPRPLVATGVEGDLPPNPTTPVQAGVPPHQAIRVQAGVHPHQAIQVEDGAPLRQEVAGVSPKW